MRQKILAPALLAGLVALGACAAPAAQPTAAPAAAQPTIALPTAAANPTVVSEPGAPIALGVTASGEVTARRTAELVFRLPGAVVAEVLVDEGAQVREGQELARLDTAELELQIKQAEAALAGARANYERLVEGASDEDVAAARAQLAQAQAGLRTAQGSVTDQDIAAAEAALQQALARQAEVRGGPKQADLAQAQAAVDQARANLEIQRTNLSAAKTNAGLQIELAANALRDAQKAYSDIYWKVKETEELYAKYGLGEIPQELKDAETQALRAVQSAEARLEQTKLAYEQAKQVEIEGLAAAEAQVRNAETNLQRVLDGPTADAYAAVDAAVAQARATLERLKGEQRAGQLAQAQAGVSLAQANLARVSSDPSAATLAAAMAQVQQAEAAVEAAKLNRDKAVLRAPFDGIVAAVNIDPGDPSSSGQLPAIQVVDLSELRVEVNISDTDVARVREGMPAEVRVDAVPGEVFRGSVTYIAPTATALGNVRTYQVRITLDAQPASLRAGMSARVTVLVDG